jgi:dihydrofolate reductase
LEVVVSRELVWTGFVSVDGVIDSPGSEVEGHRHGGWVFRTPFVPEAYSLKGEELAETTALMFGRCSYDVFAPIWPGSEDHIAYKSLPKYVVSTSLDEGTLVDGWGQITVLRSVDDVAALKETEGGAIFIHGSAQLTLSLADADLIDRYNMLVFPVILGEGKSVFDRNGGAHKVLALRESAAYSNGVLKAVYDVVH